MKKDISKILRVYLFRNPGITITYLAELAQISRFSMHKYLNGEGVSLKIRKKIQTNINNAPDPDLPKIKLVD